MTRKLILTLFTLLALLIAGVMGASAQGNVTYVTYTVAEGDTLAKIAQRYCTSVQEIYDINRNTIGVDPNRIQAFMRLTVPNRCGGAVAPQPPTTGGPGIMQPIAPFDRGPRLHANGILRGNVYDIAIGDTLFSIGQRFGEDINLIAGRNNIDNLNKIFAGRPLIIPGLMPVPGQDADLDGVLDVNDRCPTQPGVAANNGCPQTFVDSDGDGIPDVSDVCPNDFGVFELNGCAGEDPATMAGDIDGDSILDAEDACPFQAGVPALDGCPGEDPDTMVGPGDPDFIDSDGDGIQDASDMCPMTPGVPDLNGCAGEDPSTMARDSDGDGLLDAEDVCPFEAAPGVPSGCPETEMTPDQADDV